MLAADLVPRWRPALSAAAPEPTPWDEAPTAPAADLFAPLPPPAALPWSAPEIVALRAPPTAAAAPPFSPEPSLSPRPGVAARSWSPPGRALQLHNTYLVVEEPDGLLLVDQHALHERILFEELKGRALSGTVEIQELLMPEPVDLPAAQADAVLEAKAELARLGLLVDDFGPGCVAVRGVPAFLPRLSPASFVKDLGARLADAQSPPRPEEFFEAALALAACKAAVKAGDPLAPEEIAALLARRHLIDDSHHCPHGRPTVLRLSLRDLEKQFKRV